MEKIGKLVKVNQSLLPSKAISSDLSLRIERVRTDFGNYEQFLTRFNPSIQNAIAARCADFADCFDMRYPKLSLIGHTYGNEAIIEWIKIQFFDLNNFTGVKEKLNEAQINQLSSLFYFDCYFLNIAEVALFFLKFKLGKFGEFFGVVDPLKIMNAKNQFLSDRKVALDRHKSKKNQEIADANREMWAKNINGLAEYRKAKRKRIFNLKKRRKRK